MSQDTQPQPRPRPRQLQRKERDVPPCEVLRVRDVLERVSLSRSLVYRLIREGTFPGPFRLTARSVAWCGEEIAAWIAQRRGA